MKMSPGVDPLFVLALLFGLNRRVERLKPNLPGGYQEIDDKEIALCHKFGNANNELRSSVSIDLAQ
jgi:hypothetical protein